MPFITSILRPSSFVLYPLLIVFCPLSFAHCPFSFILCLCRQRSHTPPSPPISLSKPQSSPDSLLLPLLPSHPTVNHPFIPTWHDRRTLECHHHPLPRHRNHLIYICMRRANELLICKCPYGRTRGWPR